MKKLKFHDISSYVIISFVLCFCVFCFVFPNIVSDAVSNSLRLCLYKLIPSLFPLLVIASFLSSGSFFSSSYKLISKPLKFIFGIPEKLSGPAFLGLITGYPSCAVAVGNIYNSKLCSKNEAEYTVAICSNPSPAFITSAIGYSLFKNQAFGILLLFSMLISVIFMSIILRNYYKYETITTSSFSVLTYPKMDISTRIVSSISSSVRLILEICGYVIFFSVAGEFIIYSIGTFFEIPNGLYSLLKGFFEISGGVFSVNTPYIHRAVLIVSTICGFSGLSVLFQIVGVLSNYNLSAHIYLVAKILMSLIFPLVLLILMILFPICIPTSFRFF